MDNPKPDNYLNKLLGRYRSALVWLFVVSIALNVGSLIIPRIISGGVDAFARGNLDTGVFALQFIGTAAVILVFSYAQNFIQVRTGEQAARYLRDQVVAKITRLDYLKVQEFTASRLLTNLTSDVDAVKMFIAQAISTLVSSMVLLVGAAILLLTINWQLALAVLAVVPVIAFVFFFVFSQATVLFTSIQSNVDTLNRVISESVIGSAIVRVLNSQALEFSKFVARNEESKRLGFGILGLFAIIIPVIGFVANVASVIILYFGGRLIFDGALTLGEYISFNSYLSLLIFPILMIGFTSQMISRANSSLARIHEVLDAPELEHAGGLKSDLQGLIKLDDISLHYEDKRVLKGVSFDIAAHTKTAIIGPTAAGKTQLMNLLAGLLIPTSGKITIDGHLLGEFDQEHLHNQIGLVFQDSLLFNTTIRENIAFNNAVSDADLSRAIDTAELRDFIDTLPEKLNTQVSERGTSLSGGQKQRVMLARALALNPKVLLLDDFTARVDAVTQKRILDNINRNYPGITVVAITQKVASVMDYEQIVLLMEGELIASGTHTELLETSPEYAQIYQSQQSTNEYELQTK